MAKSVKQLASNLKKKTLKVSNLKKELKAEEAALARITKELSAAKKSKVPAKNQKLHQKKSVQQPRKPKRSNRNQIIEIIRRGA